MAGPSEIIHRITRLDRDVDMNVDDGVYLSLRGKWTLNYGVAHLRGDRVERLVYEDNNVGRLQKASDADVFAYVAQELRRLSGLLRGVTTSTMPAR